MSDVPEFLPDSAAVAVDPGARTAGEREVAPPPGNSIRLGPSRLYAFWILGFNPLSWMAMTLAAFAHSAHFRAWLYSVMAGLPGVQRGMIHYYVWQKGTFLPLWFWPAAIVVIYMAVRITTTHYYLTSDGILSIKHGLLSLRSPGGPLAQYTDTIPMGLVLDVDLRRGLTEMIIGTGTLALRSREAASGNGWAMLYHVPKADKVRLTLMAHCPVRDARVVVSG